LTDRATSPPAGRVKLTAKLDAAAYRRLQ